MPDYQLFGGILRSEVDFPELSPLRSDSACWHLSKSALPEAAAPPVVLGREAVEHDVEVTLARYPGGLRLTFDDTGVFDISEDGRAIMWHPPEAPDLNAVRKDVLGRVMAIALGQEGIVPLHGSAVDLGGVAIAFLAPKFHGKSTTATALVNTGARLLADDLVPVTPGTQPMVLPSVPVVQLWGDSAKRVGTSAARVGTRSKSAKVQVAWTDAGRHATTPVPLGGLYLLAPVRADANAAVRRTRVAGVEAALALLGQTKVGALIGVEKRSTLLHQLADLAEVVPVYRLEVPRDFGRIGELTDTLWGWHSARQVAQIPGEKP